MDRVVPRRNFFGLMTVLLALVFIAFHTIMASPDLLSDGEALNLFDSIMRRDKLHGRRVTFNSENYACIQATTTVDGVKATNDEDYVFYRAGFVRRLMDPRDDTCMSNKEK